MVEIVDEFTENICYAEHIHEDQHVITILINDNDKVYQYENDKRIGFYRLSQHLRQLALQFVHLSKDLTLLEEVASKLQTVPLIYYIFAGKHVIGITKNKSMVLLNEKFKNQLLEGRAQDLSDCIVNTYDLSSFVCGKHSIVYIAPVSLVESPDYHVLNKDLYLSLFGLDALTYKFQVLLIFLNSGHIWYLFLKNEAIPLYLCSIDDICIKVCSQNSTLVVFTQNKKVVSFEVNHDSFKVAESWINVEKGSSVNFCNNDDTNCRWDCPSSLLIKNRALLKSKNVVKVELNLEAQLNNLRATLNSLEIEKQDVTDLLKRRFQVVQQFESLANMTTNYEKLIDFEFKENELHVRWIRHDFEHLPFCVILSSKGRSETFYSKSQSLKICSQNVRRYCRALCLFYGSGIWIICGSIDYTISDLANPAQSFKKHEL